MPYEIRKVGSQFCVYGPSGNHGCHPTREKALAQQRALYANTKDLKQELVSKQSVNYKPGVGQRQCQNCTMYTGFEGCSDVAGHISPSGYCDLFSQKLLQDTTTVDENLPPGSVDHPQQRKYAGPDRRKKQVPTNYKRRKTDYTRKSAMEQEFAPILTLEEVGGPVVLQEGQGKSPKVKVPFYVGNSVSKAPGFTEKIYFPTELLSEVVNEGNRQIAAGKQPLTFYLRHKHALTGDRLPAGHFEQLSQEGRYGFAILALNDSQDGRDALAAFRNKDLNAVSLRAGAGRFEMERKQINGEPMLVPTKLALDGIDGAPDSPAMPTYGVEVLAAEARVEPIPTRRKTMDDLTAEDLRADHPQLVAELESKVRKEYDAIVQERDELKAKIDKAERDAILQELAAKFPEPEKALPHLEELCAEAKTKEEALALAAPFLLEVVASLKENGQIKTAPTPADELRKLFKIGGAGQSLVSEEEAKPEGQLTSAGLAVPF